MSTCREEVEAVLWSASFDVDVDGSEVRPCSLHSYGLRTRLPRQQLPQHILQYPAVGVVERLLRRVEQHRSRRH